MENLRQNTVATAQIQLETLMAQLGPWRSLRTLLAVLLRTNRAPPIRPSVLSPHLRRDIGMERDPPSPTYRDFL